MQPLCMFNGAGDVQLEIVLLVSSPGSNMAHVCLDKICTSRILFWFPKRKSIYLKFLFYVLEFFFLFNFKGFQ